MANENNKIERLDFEGLKYYDGRLKEWVKKNGGVTWGKIVKNDPFNGYDYVDMGEAGIWATCNIGASNPEETGLFFQWGDTKGWTKEQAESGEKTFNSDSYKFKNTDYSENWSECLKYNPIDNLQTLELEDDAAHVNMGGGWRMPTKDEIQKLIDLCDCELDDITEDEVGYIVSLKSDDSKKMIFPCGIVRNNTFSAGQGYSLSSSIGDSYQYPSILYLRGDMYLKTSQATRYEGCPIRAIFDPTLKS